MYTHTHKHTHPTRDPGTVLEALKLEAKEFVPKPSPPPPPPPPPPPLLPPPPPAAATHVVTMAVSLPMSKASFSADKQALFKQAIAKVN